MAATWDEMLRQRGVTVHPAATAYRLLSGDALDRLAADIDRNGLKIMLRLWRATDTDPWQLLDGRSRVAAMATRPDCVDMIAGALTTAETYTGGDPFALVSSFNDERRHASIEDRRESARLLLQMDPSRSNRQVAKDSGLSPPEVAKVRAKGEEAGDVKTVFTRTDTLGRQQPAAKTVKPLGTGNNEWYTPPEIIAAARAVLSEIDLDPASNPTAQEIVQATSYFTAETDGLAQEWQGRVWINPPYARDLLPRFVDKLLAEIDAGRVTEAILLVNNCTDAGWFHAAKRRCAALLFSSGRIRFLRSDGVTPGPPTQGQAFFYFGPNVAGFTEAFCDICTDGRRLAEEVIGAIRRLPVDAFRILDEWYIGHRGTMLEPVAPIAAAEPAIDDINPPARRSPEKF